MVSKVIIASSVNLCGEAAWIANEELSRLDKGWKIVSAVTTTTVFGIMPGEMPPIHHALFTTTIALEKPD
jgi:hypothetical protein